MPILLIMLLFSWPLPIVWRTSNTQCSRSWLYSHCQDVVPLTHVLLNFSDCKCCQSENFSMADRLSKQQYLLTADVIPGHDKFIFNPMDQL